MAITVRAAVLTDLTAVVNLLGLLHDPSTATPDDASWARILEQESRTILLAERDGEPAGTADVSIAPNLTHDAKPRAYVENVSVAPEHQRHGVGSVLMREVELRARAAGCYKVMLMSGDHRPGAHRFYEELGYDRCAVGFKKEIEGS